MSSTRVVDLPRTLPLAAGPIPPVIGVLRALKILLLQKNELDGERDLSGGFSCRYPSGMDAEGSGLGPEKYRTCL